MLRRALRQSSLEESSMSPPLSAMSVLLSMASPLTMLLTMTRTVPPETVTAASALIPLLFEESEVL